MMTRLLFILLIVLLPACITEPEERVRESAYFPPVSGNWETTTPEALRWDVTKLPALTDYLEQTNTRAFIIVVGGRIAFEKYFGTTLGSAATPFTNSSNWYWASAGKTLVAATCGIAEEQGLVSFSVKTSTYLGAGWTSLSPTQEDQITIGHQLTMTTGLDDGVVNADCTLPQCLVYKAEPGQRWAYHNGAYTLLQDVVAEAAGQTFSQFFNTLLRDKIGMDGTWIVNNTYNSVYYSTPRSMARFGLLLLNRGEWNQEAIIPQEYFHSMTNSSQQLNLSYGYLTWLNGKTSFMAPTLQTVFPGSISPNAPAGMFSAMGKNGQLINVIPERDMVIIRMGDNPDATLVPFLYQDELWEKIKPVIR